MLNSTRAAVKAVCMADPSITGPQIDAALDALDGRTAAGIAVPLPVDRAISRRQAAEILGVRPHTISDYCRRGLIRPIRLGAQGKIACGYSLESIRALMEGRAGS